MTRVCTGCAASKPLAEFGTRVQRGQMYPLARCRACVAAYARTWRVAKPGRPEVIAAAKRARRAADPDRHRAAAKAWRDADPRRVRDYNLRRKYGIGVDDYDVMLAAQGGVCAACGTRDSGDRRFDCFAVDHDHRTGRVRQLLCGNCNKALGLVDDDPDQLLALAAYVLQHTDVLGASV